MYRKEIFSLRQVKTPLPNSGIVVPVSYAERLTKAMTAAGKTRADITKNTDCTKQTLYFLFASAKQGRDARLSTENNAQVATYLGVDPVWLATGDGDMNAAGTLSSAALDIATLYDLIPVKDRIRRARAYNAATGAILDVLHELPEIASAIQAKKTTGV